jgi:hypothetical protein
MDTVKNAVNFLRLQRGYLGASLETDHVIQWLVVGSRSLMIETTSFTGVHNHLILNKNYEPKITPHSHSMVN